MFQHAVIEGAVVYLPTWLGCPAPFVASPRVGFRLLVIVTLLNLIAVMVMQRMTLSMTDPHPYAVVHHWPAPVCLAAAWIAARFRLQARPPAE